MSEETDNTLIIISEIVGAAEISSLCITVNCHLGINK